MNPNFKITREGREIELEVTLGDWLGEDGSEIATVEDAAGRDWFDDLTEKETTAVWEIVAKMDIPTVVTEKCQKAFDVTNEIAMCQRSAMAGKALGDTLAEMNRGSETDFEKTDLSVVTKMFDAHPAAQCRLDTYLAGAVCAKSKDLALSDTDPTVGTCAQENGDVLGVRPLCWYVPFDKNNPPSTSSWPSGRLSRR